MSDNPEPTEWMREHFGDHSLAVMKALVASGQAAHERSLDAKIGSQLNSDDAYGSFWLSLPQEMLRHLSFLPGAEILHPHRSRYDLIVFNGAVIFPAKCASDSAGPDKLKLRVSRLRKQLFSLEKRTVADVPLDFGDFDFDAESDTPPLVPDFGSATALILVAFDCTARGGLQHVYIGDATLLDDGTVNWLYHEELPVRALSEDKTVLTLIDDEPVTRFDKGAPIPETFLELRQDGESVEAEEIKEEADDEQSADGTTDDGRV